jgi:hypothetical protein
MIAASRKQAPDENGEEIRSRLLFFYKKEKYYFLFILN